jgi:hypothetical protein
MGIFGRRLLAVAGALLLTEPAAAENHTFIIANNPDGYGIDPLPRERRAVRRDGGDRLLRVAVLRAGEIVPQDRARRDHRRGAEQRQECLRGKLRQLRRDRVLAVASWRIIFILRPAPTFRDDADYFSTQSAHFGTSLVPHGMIGTVEVEFFGEPLDQPVRVDLCRPARCA